MTYVIFFIGMFFLGETVLLPAIYLSLVGQMSIVAVVILSTIANLLSDLAWYFAARLLPIDNIKKWKRVERHQETFTKLGLLLNRHEYYILFASKFVYGTRILVQIICGTRRTPLGKYFIVNLAGTILYLAFLYTAAFGVNKLSTNFYAEVLIFIGLVAAMNLIIRWITEKRWFQS